MIGNKVAWNWPFVFVIAAWWAGSLFLWGDLGLWNDDYAYDRRDFVTLENTLPFGGLLTSFFYRPLYYLVAPTLITSFAGSPWVLHWINAAVHLCVVLLVWRLLFRLGCGRDRAAAGAAIMAVYPAHFEAVLWPSALPSMIATGLLAALALLMARWLTGRIRWWMVIASMGLGLAIPCFNEQPAACLPALLLIGMAIKQPCSSLRARFGRSALLCGAALLGAGIYVAMFLMTVPPGWRGTTGTFVQLTAMQDSLDSTVDAARYFMLMHDVRGGAMRQGISELAAQPVHTFVIALILLVSLRGFISGRGDEPADADRSGFSQPARGMLAAAGMGTGVFLFAWIPVFLIAAQGVEPRLCYAPVLGLGIFAACLSESLRRFGPALSNVLSVVFAVVIAASLLIMIGEQSALKNRWQLDQKQAVQLVALVPNPPPRAVFIPVEIRDRAAATGSDRFDRYFVGPFEKPWSSKYYLKRIYKRKDLIATWHDRWTWDLPYKSVCASGIVIDDRGHPAVDKLPGRYQLDGQGRKIIPWEIAVPFVLDEDGNVRLIGSFEVETSQGMRTYTTNTTAAAMSSSKAIVRIDHAGNSLVQPGK